jgi:hypothetical protein
MLSIKKRPCSKKGTLLELQLKHCLIYILYLLALMLFRGRETVKKKLGNYPRYFPVNALNVGVTIRRKEKKREVSTTCNVSFVINVRT